MDTVDDPKSLVISIVVMFAIGFGVIAAILASIPGKTVEWQVHGTIKLIGVDHGDDTGTVRYLRLKENDVTYECDSYRLAACATLQAGEVVTMRVANDDSANIQNGVYSLKLH